VNVTGVRFDEPTGSNYIGIGVPVLEPGSGRFIGAVSALVDVSSLFSLFDRQRVGRSGRVLLVSRDGTVISAPNVTPALKLKSEEFLAVRDALSTVEGRQTGYVRATVKNGSRLVGFSETEVAKTYPNLGWLILVSQDQQEALAPVLTLVQFAFLMVVFGLLMLTLLVVYFSLHQQDQFDQKKILQIQEGSRRSEAS
jgi:hypothetical protein